MLITWLGYNGKNLGWSTMVLSSEVCARNPDADLSSKFSSASPTTYYRQIGTTITLRPNQEMALSN